jgi:hypothetical protein
MGHLSTGAVCCDLAGLQYEVGFYLTRHLDQGTWGEGRASGPGGKRRPRIPDPRRSELAAPIPFLIGCLNAATPPGGGEARGSGRAGGDRALRM